MNLKDPRARIHILLPRIQSNLHKRPLNNLVPKVSHLSPGNEVGPLLYVPQRSLKRVRTLSETDEQWISSIPHAIGLCFCLVLFCWYTLIYFLKTYTSYTSRQNKRKKIVTSHPNLPITAIFSPISKDGRCKKFDCMILTIQSLQFSSFKLEFSNCLSRKFYLQATLIFLKALLSFNCFHVTKRLQIHDVYMKL